MGEPSEVWGVCLTFSLFFQAECRFLMCGRQQANAIYFASKLICRGANLIKKKMLADRGGEKEFLSKNTSICQWTE